MCRAHLLHIGTSPVLLLLPRLLGRLCNGFLELSLPVLVQGGLIRLELRLEGVLRVQLGLEELIELPVVLLDVRG